MIYFNEELREVNVNILLKFDNKWDGAHCLGKRWKGFFYIGREIM